MQLQILQKKSPSTVNSSATAKQLSAANSILSLLSKTLHHDQQMSTLDKHNSTTIRPNLFYKYEVQVQVKREVHEKNMKETKDNFDVYNFCKLLHTKKWDEFIKNPLNDKAKRDCLDKMTKRSKYNLSDLSEEEKKNKMNKYLPCAIQWEGMTLDVRDIKGGV
jgi:hypothetical protein